MKAMKAIIFSHDNGGSYVMDRDGCFRFVRGHSSQPIGTEIEVREQPTTVSLMRVASMAACFILIVCVSVFTWLWNVTDYYVYVDINPSVELRFNGFGRLRNTAALNGDAERLLDGMKLKGAADEVVVSLIEEARRQNFLDASSGEPKVLITVVSARGRSLEKMISRINTALAESGMKEFTVVEEGSMEFRDKAAGLGVSPGKLKLAEALMKGAGWNMTLEEILQIPLGELYAAVNNPEETGGARIADANDPDSGPEVTQTPTIDSSGDDRGDSGQPGPGDDIGVPLADPLGDDPDVTVPGAATLSTAGTITGSADPSTTDLPAIETPTTDLPVIEPPTTEPPATEPPATEPPATEPPPTEPPATEPPVTGSPGADRPDREPNDSRPGNDGSDKPDDNDPGTNPPPLPHDEDCDCEECNPAPLPHDEDCDCEECNPSDGKHAEDCDCEICIGVSSEGFGATVYALVKGSGNQRTVAITVIDIFAQYSQTFGYSNGTSNGTYRIVGESLIYIVEITYAGNAVQTVFITGVETSEGDSFGVTVTASVEGLGVDRTVVITITDSEGASVKTFYYTNGTSSESYLVERDNRVYKVFIIYRGNEVINVMIIDYYDDDGEGDG